jgi:O-antigen/teichoic acid export membrane protein
MGIIIRQSIKSSIVTYFGVVIGTINVLFLYNKFLTPEQLGLYTALISFPLVFSSLSNLGTPHVATRFFNQFADEKNKHNGFLGYVITAPMIGFLLFLMIYAIFKSIFEDIYSENSPLLLKYFWIFPIITFFCIYQNVLEAYSRVHLRIVVPAIIREVFLKLSNSALALLFGFGFISFDQLVFGIIIFYFLAICFLLIYFKILGKLFLKFDFSFIKKPIFKEMYKYGLWTMAGGATATILPHIEKIMLPAYKGGLEQTAIFNIALSIGLVIAIPRNAISSISEPLLAESWTKKNLEHILEIYKKSALNLLIVGVLLFLGIWCNIDSIFNIIPNSEIYQKGKFVVLIVGLYSVFDMATGLNSEILKNSPYYKYDFVFYIARFVILLISNLILIPIYGYNGAAVAMLVSVIIYNGIKYIFIQQKLNMQPFDLKTVKVLFLGIFTFILVSFIPKIDGSFFNEITSIIIKSILIVAIYASGIILLKVSDDVNNIFRLVLEKLRLK